VTSIIAVIHTMEGTGKVLLTSTTPNDMAELSLDDLVHRPGVYVVQITPTDAQALLERNTNNRLPKPTAIERYARSMKDGQWKVTNQGLGIGRNGELVDGQNRLLACIEAGVPFETTIATGLDGGAKDVVDVGVRRSLGDSLRMAGYTNTVALAGGVTLRMRYEEAIKDGQPWTYGRRRGASNIPHDEAVEYLKLHEQMVEHTARSWVLRKVFTKVPLSVVIAFESLAFEFDPYKAEEFLDGITTGANLSLGDPRLTLRNYLMRREDKYSRGRDSMHLLAMFIKAFNDFVNGEKREIIVMKDNEVVPALGAKRRPRYGKNKPSTEEDAALADSEVVLA
jgi:hypothetical protein